MRLGHYSRKLHHEVLSHRVVLAFLVVDALSKVNFHEIFQLLR